MFFSLPVFCPYLISSTKAMALFCWCFSLKMFRASGHIWQKKTLFIEGRTKSGFFYLDRRGLEPACCSLFALTGAQTMSGLTPFLFAEAPVSVGSTSLEAISATPELAGYVLTTASEQAAASLSTTQRNCCAFVRTKEK